MALEFSCKFCGHCCEGKGGIVVGKADLERLCLHLSITQQQFEEKYGERRSEKLHVRAGQNGFCVFFISGKGCAVHSAKPNVCKAWPYFRGNLLDSYSLELAKASCAGIDPSISLENFRAQGIAYLQEHNLLASSAQAEAGALCINDILQAQALLTSPERAK